MEGVLTLFSDTIEPRPTQRDQGQLCPSPGNHMDDSQEVQWLKLSLTRGSHSLIPFSKMSRHKPSCSLHSRALLELHGLWK